MRWNTPCYFDTSTALQDPGRESVPARALQSFDFQQHLGLHTFLAHRGVHDGGRVPRDLLVRKLEGEARQQSGEDDF